MRLQPAMADRSKVRTPLRFVLVGAANTALSYAIYVVGIRTGLSYAAASLVALIFGIASGFVLQGRITFQHQLRGRLPMFLALWSLLYFANVVLIGGLMIAGANAYLAGLGSAVPVTGLAYWLQKRIVFAESPPAGRHLLLPWLIALAAIARVDIALRHEINWDEFLNLSMVYSHSRGELNEVLQTAFVHLLGWVDFVSINEAEQVIAARIAMLAVAVITSFAIYVAAKTFAGRGAGLMAVLAYNSFGFVMLHGAALRTDTFATSALSIAIALAIVKRPDSGSALLIGMAAGFAGAMTIKSVFLVPTIGVLLLTHPSHGCNLGRAIGHASLAAVSGAVTFLAIVGLHALTFPTLQSPFAFVERTSGATLLTGDYTSLANYLPTLMLLNPGFWILILSGLRGAFLHLGREKLRMKAVSLFSLTLPLLSLAVYRDAFPYFYPLILAPLAILAGYGWARLRPRIKGYPIALMALSGALTYAQALRHPNADQRFVLDTVHRLFPSPVSYIAHTSMVASFPKKGPFMSIWGMTDYRRRNKAIMADIIAQSQPKFLLVTRGLLDVDGMDPAASERRPLGLLGNDVVALQRNYLRYWGPLYLPGKALSGSGLMAIEIGGRYRLVADGPVKIEGRTIEPGKLLNLTTGRYAFSAGATALLRWDAPPPPVEDPPERLFDGF